MGDDKNASALMLAAVAVAIVAFAVAVAIVAFSTVASFGADQCGEGREPMDMGHYWCVNGEGWSGDAEKEPDPPWIVVKPAESKPVPDDLPPEEN